MRFLTRWLSRKMLSVVAAVGLLQVVGFAAYLLGSEAVTVAVFMATSMLLLMLGFVVLRKVNAVAEAVQDRRMERVVRNAMTGRGSGEAETDRAEYMVRRILAAFEQERYQTERRFKELASEAAKTE